MRKVSKAAADAFMRGVNFRSNNTRVVVDKVKGVTLMFLFGNIIAQRMSSMTIITNAGCKTPTTKDRLNAIPNVNIAQRKGKWYLNGEEWDGTPTRVPRYFQADIRWNDTGEEVKCMTIKLGNPDDDDRIFYYVDSIHELLSLYDENGGEFVITAHHEITEP